MADHQNHVDGRRQTAVDPAFDCFRDDQNQQSTQDQNADFQPDIQTLCQQWFAPVIQKHNRQTDGNSGEGSHDPHFSVVLGFFRGLPNFDHAVDVDEDGMHLQSRNKQPQNLPQAEAYKDCQNIGFTKEIVQAQLDRNAESRYRLFTLEYRPPYRPKKFPLEDELRRLEFSIDHSYDAATVLVDTIFFIIITVIQTAAELADVMLLSPDLRVVEKDLKDLIADYHFLKENDIHTVADLQANIDDSKAQLSDLERERKDVSNRIRRPKSPEDDNQNKERRKAISKQMKPVRERLRRAEKILEKSPHLYELLKQEHEFERKARARYLDRSR